jgi:O-antigen ligase
VAGCVFIGVTIQQKYKPALIRTGVLAVLCIGAMLPFINRDLPFLAGRFNAGNTFAENRVEHGSFMEREYLFEKSNELFIDHAILGTGLGASPVSLHRAFPQFPTNYQPPHFTLLAASLEIGIIGSTFYFLLLVTPIIVFFSQYRKITQHPARVTAFALLLAITVVGLFDYYTWLLVPGRLWQWTAWGLWAGAHKDHELA